MGAIVGRGPSLESLQGACHSRSSVASNVDHLCFRVEPFDEATIRAHLASLAIAAGPTESRYGAEGEGPSIYLRDPQGNTVELKGPPAA